MSVRNVAFVREHRRRQASDLPIGVRSVGELRYFVPQFKREFDYTFLGRILKPGLARLLASSHVEYLTRFSRSYAVACFLAMRRFAEFVQVSHDPDGHLKQFDSLSVGAGAIAWRNAVIAYVQVLEQRPVALTTFAEEIGNLFRGLDELASRGHSASCDRPILPKNYHASGRHRPGLVEQSSKTPVAPELLARLEAHIDSLNLPIRGQEAHDLLGALAAQVPIEVLHDEVAVAEAIFKLNAQAIDDIRSVAEETFIHWRDVWRRGQNLLNAEVPKEQKKAIRRYKNHAKLDVRTDRGSLFFSEDSDEATRSFLTLFYEFCGPQVPAEVEKGWPKSMKSAYQRLGGREFFEACFTLHRRAVAAAVILYLVDSGANVSTALSLTTESEQQTDDPNFVHFVSFKDRAGPAPIVKQLPLKSHGVKVTSAEALREVNLMTQSRRDIYPDLLGESLFIFSFFGQPSVLTDAVLADNLRYMLRDRQMPQLWTPSAIRVAVGVDVSGKTNGDLAKVGRKLSHALGSSATPIYALRLAARLMLVHKIREYQTLLEAAFSTHTTHGPVVLGYREETADVLVTRAVRTGLGFLCRNAAALVRKFEGHGGTCPDVGTGCSDCHVSVFIADVDSLAEMVAVRKSLAKSLEAIGEADLEVWMKKWRDLYAFSSAVLHKVKTSRFAYLMPKANQIASALLSEGFDPTLVRD